MHEVAIRLAENALRFQLFSHTICKLYICFIAAEDIAEKSLGLAQYNSTVDNGIKSFDTSKTQILDQVESRSLLTCAADDANEISHVPNIVDEPANSNDSISLKVESSSSSDAVGGVNTLDDADRSDVESEVSASTAEQQHEPEAPESDVGVQSAVDSLGDSPKAAALM